MRYLVLVTTVMLAFACGTSGANARNLWNTKVGAWIIGAYANNKTGQFSHCAASVPYKSGISLLFSIDRVGWKMGFANTAWQLTPGSSYPIQYQIDRGPILSATAVAQTKELATVNLVDSTRLFRMFRRGYELKVSAANELFRFYLKDSSRALAVTLRCASRWMKRRNSTVAANPFKTAPSNPFETAPSKPAGGIDGGSGLRAEAATFAANTLSGAGIQGFRLAEKIPKALSSYHAAFAAKDIIGGVLVAPNASQEKAVATVLAADGAACKGRFASVKVPTAGNNVTQIKTACSAADGALHSVYTVVRRPEGGVYLMTVLEVGTSGEAAADAGTRMLEVSEQRFGK